MLAYRLSAMTDPEERLEDACLAQAMAFTYRDGIRILAPTDPLPTAAHIFGRKRHYEDTRPYAGASDPVYWRDPAFLASIGRLFLVADFETATQAVEDLHAKGRDAFIKGTKPKQLAMRVPVGTGLEEAVGDLIWSFLDMPECLMVQEAVDMSFKRRFLVIDRQIVTHSAVAWHLTPLFRSEAWERFGTAAESVGFRTPRDMDPVITPEIIAAQTRHADELARRMSCPHGVVDVAMVNGRPETIEINPCQPGMFGLYAMDPKAIAAASLSLLPPALQAEVLRRREEKDPWPDTTSGPPAAAPEPDEPAWDDGP